MRSGLLLALALIVATPVMAAEQVVALSPAEKEKLLDAAADRNVDAIGEPTINGIGRQIHGEVCMFVGTHGARGMFGSTVIPVGESSTLGLAFETSRFGR
jgi:hypothetical protein